MDWSDKAEVYRTICASFSGICWVIAAINSKWTEGLEIRLVTAMAHLCAADNRTRFLDIAQLGQRKGVAGDVLGNILDALGVTRLKPNFVMNPEP